MRIVTERHRGCRRPGPGDEWTAIDADTYDGADDARCPVGSGATENEAIADLTERLEEQAP